MTPTTRPSRTRRILGVRRPSSQVTWGYTTAPDSQYGARVWTSRNPSLCWVGLNQYGRISKRSDKAGLTHIERLLPLGKTGGAQ